MELEIGKQYLYTIDKKVYKQGSLKTKRKTLKRIVTYKGTEGDKYVFETESGSEVLIHQSDLNSVISKVEVQ